MSKIKSYYWCLFIVFTACHAIKTGEELNETDTRRIQQLGLLDSDENILKFYSEFKTSVAGNFFTNKRMANYWIDEDNKDKNQISTAFYTDIISMDTVYNAGLTYAPFLRVTRADSSSFKVYFDGNKEELRKTFLEAIETWGRNKN